MRNFQQLQRQLLTLIGRAVVGSVNLVLNARPWMLS
jgi:hypothetical protein